MQPSSRQKFSRSHKHEGRDRSWKPRVEDPANEDDGALKEGKPRVENPRVSEPEKRKDRADDTAVAVVDYLWSGGAEDEHVGEKKPKAEGFEAVDLEQAGRSKDSGGESKSRSSRRQDGASERIDEVYEKLKPEKDLSWSDNTGRDKDIKDLKDYSKVARGMDRDRGTERGKGIQHTWHERADDVVNTNTITGNSDGIVGRPRGEMNIPVSSVWDDFMNYASHFSIEPLPEFVLPGYKGGHPYQMKPRAESNTVRVDGLPPNCAEREITHIFRPFVGFEEVRFVNGICYTIFSTPDQARLALEVLKGYKVDPDLGGETLRLEYAAEPPRERTMRRRL